MKERDLVLFEQVQDSVVVLLDHGVFATEHLGNVNRQILQPNAVIRKVVPRVLKMFRRLQQGFAWNAAHIGTSATRCRPTLGVFPLINASHAKA